MKGLKADLLTISKTMTTLTKKLDSITKKLEILEQSDTKKKQTVASLKNKPSQKVTPKTSKENKPSTAPEASTAIDTVLDIVNRSKNGVSVETLRKETDFESRKIHSILYKLKKRGKIKNEKKGVYTKA